MHPLLVLLAFTLAAAVAYVLVLGLLTALSIPTSEVAPEADARPEPDRAARGEHARH